MTDFLTIAARIIAHTPIWVWLLYALLLFLGFQRTRESIVPLWRMLILPGVVTFLTGLSFVGAGLSVLPAMLLGLAIGGGLGWLLEPEAASRRRQDGKIWLRGEWWTFSQIGLILVFRYAINVAPVLAPALNADFMWRIVTPSVAAALSAVFLGRTAARLEGFLRSGRADGASRQKVSDGLE